MSLKLPNQFYADRSRGVRYKLEQQFLNKIVHFTNTELYPALEVLIQRKTFQKDPTKFAQKMKDLEKELTQRIFSLADKHIKDILKVNLSDNFEGSWFKVPDKAIDENYNSLILQSKYKKNIETIISRTFGLLTNRFFLITESRLSKKIVEELMKTLKDTMRSSISRIQRLTYTNTTLAVNRGREIQFRQRDPNNTYRYKWQTVPDKRRTPQCEQIVLRVEADMRRTGDKGVTLSRLKQIVTEVANLPQFRKSNPNIDWTPHYNCRSTIRRSFGN